MAVDQKCFQHEGASEERCRFGSRTIQTDIFGNFGNTDLDVNLCNGLGPSYGVQAKNVLDTVFHCLSMPRAMRLIESSSFDRQQGGFRGYLGHVALFFLFFYFSRFCWDVNSATPPRVSHGALPARVARRLWSLKARPSCSTLAGTLWAELEFGWTL